MGNVPAGIQSSPGEGDNEPNNFGSHHEHDRIYKIGPVAFQIVAIMVLVFIGKSFVWFAVFCLFVSQFLAFMRLYDILQVFPIGYGQSVCVQRAKRNEYRILILTASIAQMTPAMMLMDYTSIGVLSYLMGLAASSFGSYSAAWAIASIVGYVVKLSNRR